MRICKFKHFINENRKSINYNTLPDVMYHVTTNYNKVIESGVLLAKSGLDSGGLGGTDSVGVSFVSDINIANSIFDELVLLNKVNGAKNETEILKVLNDIPNKERRDFIIAQYDYTLSVYKDPHDTAIMAIRLSRYSSKFNHEYFSKIIIFHEENIKNKDIGIIKVHKSKISPDTQIIEGVDKDLGEIRVLSDIKL